VITITWAVGKDPTRFHDTLIAKFEKKFPHIKVRLLEMPEPATTMHDAYVTYLSARDPSVDVYSIDIIWPPEFGSAEWLLPLNEYISDEEMEAFLPGPIEGCTYRGSLYAIPWFTNGGVLYYRADLLKKENIVRPSTWTELVHHAKLLKKYGVYGFVFQAHQYEGLVCNSLEYVWSNGGEVFDEDRNVVINSDEAVESLQFMKDIIHKYKITPPGVVTYKEEEARRLFTEGKAAFMRNWPYLWAIDQDSAKGSKVDGANRWARFWHITFPLLSPTLLVAFLFRSMDAFRVFDLIFVLTGGGTGNSTETMSIYAYKTLFSHLRFGYGSALHSISFLVAGLDFSKTF